MTTNGQLNDTHGYHIKPTNSMSNLISGFRLKGPCSSVCGKKNNVCGSAVKSLLLSKSVIKEKYFDKYKNHNMYAKLRVAVGAHFSIYWQ